MLSFSGPATGQLAGRSGAQELILFATVVLMLIDGPFCGFSESAESEQFFQADCEDAQVFDNFVRRREALCHLRRKQEGDCIEQLRSPVRPLHWFSSDCRPDCRILRQRCDSDPNQAAGKNVRGIVDAQVYPRNGESQANIQAKKETETARDEENAGGQRKPQGAVVAREGTPAQQ